MNDSTTMNYRTRAIHRKKYRRKLVPFLAFFGFLGITGTSLLLVAQHRGFALYNKDRVKSDPFPLGRKLLETSTLATETTTDNISVTTEYFPSKCLKNPDAGSTFPNDLFSDEQLGRGAASLHFFGLIYMFVALAIVCDEFFVPSLGVITENLAISDDVAGATFMAAGGSAPEFFTSMIGVFIVQDNVGIGTIVGSATFNILCVLAFCTLFSKGILHLTWWPLFRDVAFYILALALLVIFFLDEEIYWWEALTLFVVYFMYITFMKYNEQLEFLVKTRILGQTIQVLAPEPSSGTNMPVQNEPQMPPEPPPPAAGDYGTYQAASRPSTGHVGPRRRSSAAARRQSIPILHSGAMFRNGIVQLMVHTLDPLSELPGTPEDDEVFSQGQGGGHRPPTGGTQRTTTTKAASASSANGPSLPEDEETRPRDRKGTQETPLGDDHSSDQVGYQQNYRIQNGGFNDDRTRSKVEPSNGATSNIGTKEITTLPDDEEVEEPLDISWPSTCRKQATYILLLPIVFPLWLTVPDVRKPESRRWFPVTFCFSICWIAFFSWLMVWWADTIGRVLGIPSEVMGLTILAAGTSIPDLITSVIVARKGLGDMAVSSSIGSNIFDVCVGLPVPWMLFLAINVGTVGYVSVISRGLVCSVGMLFIMLVILILAIALFNWKMNKPFGIVMIFAYIGFCVFAVLLELNKISCPLRFSECANRDM